MKSLLTFVAACCLTAFVGCASTSDTSTGTSASVAPGAVTECSSDCSSACSDAEKAECPVSGEVAPGAVGSPDCEPAACESGTKTCPVSGKTDGSASLGAVGEGCSSAKTSSCESSCTKSTDG